MRLLSPTMQAKPLEPGACEAAPRKRLSIELTRPTVAAAAWQRRRRDLLALLAALFALPAWAQAQGNAFDLAQLMPLLAQTRSGEARFTERRTVAMLERPLESSGRLWFEAPDTFVRETLKPREGKAESAQVSESDQRPDPVRPMDRGQRFIGQMTAVRALAEIAHELKSMPEVHLRQPLTVAGR